MSSLARRLVVFLNTVPTVKAALVMGSFVFASSIAGSTVGRMLAVHAFPNASAIHCVCSP